MTDEWPPAKARSLADWDAYWHRQRWDRRLRRKVRIRVFRLRHHVPHPVRRVRTDWHRSQHGWAPRDLWSMDDYICRVLGEMTTEMRRTAHGHPCNPDSKYETCGSMPGSGQCGCEQDWDATLEWISAPLLAYKTHWDYQDGETVQQHIEREKIVIGQAQNALRRLADVLPSMWD